MSIKAHIYHLTHYRYDRLVTLSPQIIRLRPAPHSRTHVISHSLKVGPQPYFVNHQQDPYGNWLARFVFPEPVRELKIEVDLTADLSVYNPFDFFVDATAEFWPFTYPEELQADLLIYRQTEELGPLLKIWLQSVPQERKRTVDLLVDLNYRLSREVKYLIRLEPGVQDPEETLGRGSGSCRDSSWLLVQILRHLGFAARFVSGYLMQLKPDLPSLDGPSGTDHDFTDLHAWCEVYLPGAGWIGLDPTSGLLTGESHVPLAATPHYRNAAPISGASSQAKVDFHFDMQIQRIAEHPRITKPYTDEAWENLLQLGDQIEDVLQVEDVRLTMGGEPTFVSIDDFESAEWNTAAVGPHKRKLADHLFRRLQQRFAPGGLLHFGQGKWYPGETLPRWTLSMYWRKDGKALWREPKWIASPEASAAPPDSQQPCQLLECIADVLEVPREFVQPAYEDPAEWILREGQLPPNVTPSNSKLEDPEERQRMMQVFERGLNQPTGFVLPIQAWQSKNSSLRRWRSERWQTRRGHLLLVPGDSALGYRLPLGSLPYLTPAQYPYLYPVDPSVARSDLPDVSREVLQQRHQPAQYQLDTPTSAGTFGPANTIQGAVRTALAAEVRDGVLCVFFPPTERIEDYLELVAAVETSAERLQLPVQLEGYPPPADPRLQVLRVAPDPGVIEVNIHPAQNWRECVSYTETLYEEARLARLGADKFMIDGRHTGTGGGNHVVVGGATPTDSPFLRRPDLLKSLLLYWQRHPSLSYLFSGLFIGPTSQAPRIDEARHDGLYELEIALSQIPHPAQGPAPLPWLTDRLLRNLLADVSGNTHRTEICIDKLFNPEGPTGRLGLVEFRSFEMPPSARMSLAQQLLLRALIARFWKHPLEAKPVRWGTQLHDRFLLGHYVWEDFQEVLQDLRSHGFPFQSVWYEAQAEFRFPFYGEVEYEGAHLELRQALEPWHVLGEMGAIGGTVRYTDSSTERLQVKLTAADPGRYWVTCNQRPVPLPIHHSENKTVAGVRFKAWQPPEALHPTIPVHAPLVFDLYDTWNQRSLGGCVYHVAHPGGRNYETFPVNSYEAEARRLARFQPSGHTPGSFQPVREVPSAEFPLTLDLRRPPQL